MNARRRRLDLELVARGLLGGPDEARRVIESRRVLIDGAPAFSPSTLVSGDSRLTVLDRRPFVSRGGEKLAGALQDLGVNARGKLCLDAGAGSGGFTDCLLQQGAASVVAVDVGYGQFDWRLRNDPRVRLLERTNIRSLTPDAAGGRFDLVVADLSFIGLGKVAGPLAALASEKGSLLLMVKPQHEAGRFDVEEGGIVRDPSVWLKSIESVAARLVEQGFGVVGVAPSRLRGAEGNQEFFLRAERGLASRSSTFKTAVDAAGALGQGEP